jgi:hypothetical protein
MAFMGSCFAGAIASSHAFFIFNVSVSSVVGPLRGAETSFFDELPFWGDVRGLFTTMRALGRHTRPLLGKPGGSTKLLFFGFAGGVELSSCTQSGIGGGGLLVLGGMLGNC